MKFNKKEAAVIFFLIVLGLFFRWNLVRGNRFLFYFDQARDAYLARSIIEKKDFKIQGPSASGTNDTIFHGVLYYYLIGPIYTFSSGNPVWVTFFLIFLNSLTVIPIYLIVKDISKSRTTGYIASILYSFSADAAQMGSWLSNPSIASVCIPLFYFFVWKVFFTNQEKYLPLLALALGINHQLVISSSYLIGCLAIAYLYRTLKERRVFLFGTKPLLKCLLIYTITVSTMLVNQFKLYKAGIFTPQNFFGQLENRMDFISTGLEIFKLYTGKVSYALFPSLPKMSSFIFVLILVWFLAQNSFKKSKLFLIIWLFGPLWLLLFSFRNSYHTLVGTLPAIFIIISLSLYQLTKSNIGKIFIRAWQSGAAGARQMKPINKLKLKIPRLLSRGGFILIFLSLFTFSNVEAIQQIRKQEYNHLSVQRGAYLNKLLSLIDLTYKKAKGQNFSISTYTVPLGYSTTWAYLYSWYGLKNYGYAPFWFGPSQVGIPAGELLTKTENPSKLHFTIYEPGTPDTFRKEFEQIQNDYSGTPSAQYQFGSLLLEVR